MNNTYRKNLKDLGVALKNYTDSKYEDAVIYCNESIANLEWQIGTYNYDVTTDSNVARIKTLPNDTYKSQIDYIGGKTCKYNQLVRNGNFSDTSLWAVNNGTITVSNNIATFIATAQNGNLNQYLVDNYIDNHKYLAIVQVKLTTATTNVQLYCNGGYGSKYTTATTEWQTLSNIFTGYSNDSKNVQIRDKRESDWDAIQVRNFMLIDLTLNYGAGNEPSDVATAIPLLKANGYNLDGTDEYSTGSLKHAITTSVKYLPINVWDEEWEAGSIDDSGTVVQTQTIYGTSFMPCIPNTTYYSSSNQVRMCYYDENKNFLYRDTNASNTHLTPNNCYFFRITMTGVYGTTYNNDICINISNASYNGNYYPYVAPITKAIPSEVLADVRYGLGYDNTNYNHLDSDGHLRGKYKTKTYSGSEVYGSTGSNYSNIIYYKIRKPLDYVGYNSYSTMAGNVKNTKYEISSPASFDSSNYIGTINSTAENTAFWIGFPIGTTLEQAQAQIDGLKMIYELNDSFDEDYSQYFTDGWNKVDLDNQYATCEMVCDEPIDMPNSITNLIKEVKA